MLPELAVVDHAPPPADARRDTSRDSGGSPDAWPLGPYQVARGIVHLHSAYSHDACDGHGLTNGQPDATCVSQLRAALCSRGFAFAMLTDHPAYMADHTMTEDLLYSQTAGDQLVMENGAPIANRMSCPGGQSVLLSVGFEATHVMPLGLHTLPPGGSSGSLYAGASDATGAAQIKQQVQGLQAAGAVVSMVHSEETDISAPTIDAAGYEAMEWYNVHAAILALAGADTLTFDVKNIPALVTLVGKLMTISPFLSSGGPHPDLVYLPLLDPMPLAGRDKWRQIVAGRPITGLFGTDAHQNVVVNTSTCAGLMQVVCAGALSAVESTMGITIPAVLKNLLLQGGNVILSDGDRVDSYLRLMRWLENRLLVKSVDLAELQDAVRNGRAYGVQTVFGDPHSFAFSGTQGGNLLQMGDSASGSLTLHLSVPDRPVPIPSGAPFSTTDALKAQVRAELLRIDGSGASVVQQVTALGGQLTTPVSQPGAYHVQIWITPRHLEGALGSSAALAQKEYLWVITNPIYVK